MFESPPVEAGVAGGRKGVCSSPVFRVPVARAGPDWGKGAWTVATKTDSKPTSQRQGGLQGPWSGGRGVGAGEGRDTGGPPLRRPRRTRNEKPSEKQGAMRPIAGQTRETHGQWASPRLHCAQNLYRAFVHRPWLATIAPCIGRACSGGGVSEGVTCARVTRSLAWDVYCSSQAVWRVCCEYEQQVLAGVLKGPSDACLHEG